MPGSASQTSRSPDEVAGRYRVELLTGVALAPEGVRHGPRGQRQTLPWGRIEQVAATEVGEPEGVRTVVFDLILERKQADCLAYRFDAEPGPEAQQVAKALVGGLGEERCPRALVELADEGILTRWVPDLETLAEQMLDELGA